MRLLLLILLCTLAFEDRIAHGLLHYSRTGNVSDELRQDLEQVGQTDKPLQPHYRKFGGYTKGFTDDVKDVTFCTLCNVAAKTLLTYRVLGGPKFLAASALKLLCYTVASVKICDGLIDLNIDIFLYVMEKKPNLTYTKMCSIIGQSFKCEASKHENDWNIYLRPKVADNPQISISKRPTPNNKPIRILHITDIHYDHKYKVGATTKCGAPLCCGSDQGVPSNSKDGAGAWGDYRSCDMPLHAVENLMDVASKHEVDFVYHTGDIIDHRVWETSRKTNTESILLINKLFRKYFPNTTIYNIAGNHEPNPLNEFAPDEVINGDLTTHWLYDMLANEWSTWLPNSTQSTIRKGGYYTVLVRPGFRIIALNSNVCYVYNWWLLYNDVDPYGQLQWLANTLYQAELDGEVVHILTHVPSGNTECYKTWSREYNKIISRHANIIKAQFCGHTHYSEMNLYYDQDKEEPINVVFNGGSFTTFIDLNPNYRIYDVNPDTYQVENYEDWIYNINEANKNDISVPPKWYKLHSFKETFNLPSLDLSQLGKFVHSLATNSTLLNTYYRLKVKAADPMLHGGCKKECKKNLLCDLVTTEYDVLDRCKKLQKEYRQAKSLH